MVVISDFFPEAPESPDKKWSSLGHAFGAPEKLEQNGSTVAPAAPENVDPPIPHGRGALLGGALYVDMHTAQENKKT